MLPHPLTILPFVAMLFSIALLPLCFSGFCERNYHRVAMILGAIPVLYYLLVLKQPMPMLHAAYEYVSFVALIGSLFVVAGGIHIRVHGEAKPWVNCVFLGVGAVIANVIGTTGASMLLIRPWIKMNKYRITGFHIVFFIFIVSNIGGLLTPIGDPPLFLGYLKGVPFWWVIEHCWEAWVIGVGWVIAVFYVLDRANFRRAPQEVRAVETASGTWKVAGLHNLFFLAMILVAVFISRPVGLRELLMITAAFGSYRFTAKPIHDANDFTFHPVKEVAWIFGGIFATMVPALHLLEHHAAQIGLKTEAQFYWGTGLLSALLDNAPTYLALLSAAFGLHHLSVENPADMSEFIATHEQFLVAISIGAVLFGAMTYIGNGPNFMVKAIAERAKVETPGFVSYIWKYSIPVLLPFCAIIGLLFFSRWRWF